ncbi:MAG TPA: hypothetical protein ENJ35_02445 [Gammaproteobacteria bacterium]|nr:hypothetical protein [Gammaproteobacteria bacterium]
MKKICLLICVAIISGCGSMIPYYPMNERTLNGMTNRQLCARSKVLAWTYRASKDALFSGNQHKEVRKERMKLDEILWARTPDWDWPTINMGKVWIGMSDAQAVCAWGEPTRINRSVNRYGASEQWVYQRGTVNTQYLYFESKKLMAIQ